ncbi:MAG: carbamoyltransferase [Bacteroidetes bacterium]|nr:carbamoyltransferase [Bacteroidota bacterium]
MDKQTGNLDPKKYYIGIASGFHDAAIALVNNEGEIVFAEASERFTQNKRSLTSVADNYFFVEKIVNKYSFSDYEIAINWKLFDSLFKSLSAASIIFTIRRYKKISKLISSGLFKIDVDLFSSVVDFEASSQYAMLSTVGASFKNILYQKLSLPYKPNHHFDHHTCHAYYAFYTSNVTDATILILDGNGDNNSSYTIFTASNQSIKKTYTNKSRASLGDFYGDVTKWCGYSSITGEQWKVMGMAPYGKLNEALYNDLKQLISTKDIALIKNKTKQDIFKNIKNGKYHQITVQDIAYTCQLFYEDITIELINSIYKKYPNHNLIIAGGCALNSATNGKIHFKTPFKNVIISSAPADDGCAIGAALLSFKKCNPVKKIPHNQINPYLGFEINNSEIELLKTHSRYRNETIPYNELYKKIAQEIVSGKIIGWVQGKAEFGPRALGNRSILANPCLPDMKDKINSSVKYREEYRPFAPSVLEEYAPDYFENYHATPYMERVLQIKEGKRKLIPAVTHIDGSGRLQTVTKELNPHYYHLINEFYKLTQVPVLLNIQIEYIYRSNFYQEKHASPHVNKNL